MSEVEINDRGGFDEENWLKVDGVQVPAIEGYRLERRPGGQVRLELDVVAMNIGVVGEADVRYLIGSREVTREQVEALREAFRCSVTGQVHDRPDLAERALEALEALFPDPPDDSMLDAEDVRSAGSDPATV